MDENEVLKLVFEAINHASPVANLLRKDLERLNKEVEKVQKALQEKGLDVDEKKIVGTIKQIDSAMKQYHRGSISLQRQQDREAKRSIMEQMRLEKQRRDADHRSALQAIKAEDRVAAAARKAAQDATAAERRKQALMHMSAMQAIKAEQRVEAEYKRQRSEDLRNYRAHIKAQEQAAREAQSRARARYGGIQAAVGGAGQVAGAGARIGGIAVNTVQGVSGVLGRALSVAQRLGNVVMDVIATGIHEAAIGGSLLTAALTAAGSVVSKIGVDFNTFRENTLITLEQLTKSGERARKIFKDAFNLSIPAKFTFEEILDGMRTLEAFGLRADAIFKGTQHTASELATALAQGMEKPLSQVTRFLGNLSQGRYLLQQAAPLGLGRDEMTRHGATFDSRGAPTDRNKLLGAAMRAIEERWGNIIDKMEKTYESSLDSMISNTRVFFGKLTDGLFGSLARSFRAVSEVVKNLFESTNPNIQRMVAGLKLPFDLIGKLIEKAVEELPKIVNWMSQFVDRWNVATVIASVQASIEIISEEIGRFVSIITQGDPWGAFKSAAENTLDFIYRSWNGFLSAVDYLVKNGDRTWKAFKDAAMAAFGVIEAAVGVVASVIAAQLAKAVADGLAGGMKMIPGIGKFFGGSALPMSAGGVLGATGGGIRQLLGGPMAPAPVFTNPDGNGGVKGYDLDTKQIGQDAFGAFRSFGQGTINAGRGFFGDIYNNFVPKDARDLFKGTQDAFQSGFNSVSLYDLQRRWEERMRQRRNGILGMTRPGAPASAVPGSSNMAPGHQMFGGGAAGAAGGAMPRSIEMIDQLIDNFKAQGRAFGNDEKPGFMLGMRPLLIEKITAQVDEVRQLQEEARRNVNEEGETKSATEREQDVIKILKAREEYWKTYAEITKIERDAQQQVMDDQKAAAEAQQAMIRAQIELLPKSQQAAALSEQLTPKLRQEQQAILQKLRTTKAGTEEYYRLQEQGYKLEKEINDLKSDAATEQANRAFEGPKRQFSTLKKLIGTMPKFTQGGALRSALAPRLGAAYRGALMESDPVERQNKLMEVMDMLSEYRSAQNEADPFHGMFGAQTPLGRGRSRTRISNDLRLMPSKALQQMYGGMGQQNTGGGMAQFILNIQPGASEDEIAKMMAAALKREFAAQGF